MRSFHLARFALGVGLFGVLIGGAMATFSVSAQATATPVPTVNPAMSLMVKEAGSCPVGAAKVMLDTMLSNPEATEEAAVEAATPEATSDATEEVDTGVKCLVGEFSGNTVVPGPGEKDASGVILMSVHGSSGNLCYEIAVTNVTLPATELHVNKAGALAVSLHPRPDKNGLASGCVSAGVKLTTDIENNSANYVVDVNTSDFPNGAAQASLVAFDESMMTSSASVAPEAASTTSESTEVIAVTPEATEAVIVAPEATDMAIVTPEATAAG